MALAQVVLVGAAIAAQAAPGPLASIERLDLARYMGTWYEIAHFPNRFQSRCAGDTRAQYSAQADGTVRVVNRCRTADGDTIEAEGVARLVGAPGSAKLQVRFAPAWLSWLPAVWADYWVIDLVADYEVAAVSEPRREYLWILARSPCVDRARYAALVERLAALGLDTSRLQPTRHGAGSGEESSSDADASRCRDARQGSTMR